jgi:mono/diheme cytochrome c family protein
MTNVFFRFTLIASLLMCALPALAEPPKVEPTEKVFVAVGYGGRRMVSNDGIKWEIAAEWKENGGDDANNLISVVFAKDKFVCVGGAFPGHILVSTDGRKWREVETPKFRVSPVLFGNDRFVAGGPDKTLLWSKDGETWNKGAKIDAKEASHFRFGAFGNDRFLFLGNSGGNSPVTWIAITKDGETIEYVDVKLPQFFNMAFGKGRFVAVGADGRRMSSKDGKTWEHEATEKGIDLRSVVWTGKEFIATGGGRTYRSAEGIEWTKDEKAIPCHLLYADDKVWIGTNWPGQMQSSPDGKTWTKHEKMTPNGINALAVGAIKRTAEPEKKEQPAKEFGFNDASGMLKTHCVACHNEKTRKGGIDVTILADEKSLAKHRKIWRELAKQIEAGEMPPEDKPQPKKEERAAIVSYIRKSIAAIELAEKQKPDPGPATIRRLTRSEYNRSVRDLLGIDADIAGAVGMPEDAQGENFDNLSAALNFSDTHLERYFNAAEFIVERLYAPPKQGPKPKSGVSNELDKRLVGTSVKETLASLLRAAFRRPVEERELERYVKLVEKSAEPFPASLKPALKAMLVSPNFLIRIERDRGKTAEEAYRLTDHELAVRLSYFLTGSAPDAELSKLADTGELSKPAIYEAQVNRLLKDPKAKALTEDFAYQWFRLKKVAEARPSTEFFPTFTPKLRQSMAEEVTLFFDHLRTTDASILDLIDSKYTFVNAELAKHYDINDAAKDFHKVELKDANRGGLLGMGAVLAMTSHTNRTSPTLRGKYVLDVLLGMPPPPPPPDAGMIDESKSKGKGAKNFRELLTQHATRAACAGCHSKIDPLGFGLEVFDAVGRYRKPGPDLDASGKLPTGETFTGAAELKAILMKQKDQFTKNLVEKMLVFALGRELQPYDEAIVKTITDDVAKNDYRFSRVVLGIANSYPFQYRRDANLE